MGQIDNFSSPFLHVENTGKLLLNEKSERNLLDFNISNYSVTCIFTQSGVKLSNIIHCHTQENICNVGNKNGSTHRCSYLLNTLM